MSLRRFTWGVDLSRTPIYIYLVSFPFPTYASEQRDSLVVITPKAKKSEVWEALEELRNDSLALRPRCFLGNTLVAGLLGKASLNSVKQSAVMDLISRM